MTELNYGFKKRTLRWRLVVFFLFVLALILIACELCFGSVSYPIGDVIKVLFGETIDGVSYAVNNVRLPRMMGAVFSGFAFGMAGYVFQTLLHNPLASPDVIGISAGTSTAAVFFILVMGFRGSIVSVLAMIFGIITALVIYRLSVIKGHFTYGRMILIGIGIYALLRAVTSYLLAKAAEYDVGTTMQWLSGSLNGVQMEDVPALIIVVGVITLILVSLTRHMEIIPLGDNFAVALGLNTGFTYSVMIIGAVILVSFATSVTGPIASVAFLSGPIASSLAGKGKSCLIPAGFIGTVLTLGADLVAFHAFPVHYPVGVVTGILGAPYMLYLLIRMNRRGVN